MGDQPSTESSLDVLCYPVDGYARMSIFFKRFPERGVLEVYRIIPADAGDAFLHREFG